MGNLLMTFEIAAVLMILVVALVLFVTEKLRMDVVALLVLGEDIVGLYGVFDQRINAQSADQGFAGY